MRPAPTVYETHIDKPTGRTMQITDCEGVFFVTRSGIPFTLRSGNAYTQDHFRYKKTSFVNAAHAYNLADKLNKMFKTNIFEVHQMLTSQVVVEGGCDE